MIGQKFCPYIKRAAREDVLFATQYSINTRSLAEIQAEVFYYGVLHTEILRIARRKSGKTQKSTLQCENILLDIKDPTTDSEGRAIFDWPHWLLKAIYTKVGIMFGKFWKGERQLGRNGSPIPSPPVHFLSIRSAIKMQDRRFLEQCPHLVPVFESASDDGQNVHEPIAQPREWTIEEMRRCDYYSTVMRWARTLDNSVFV